jgi:uncharacterized glyoxalase superfamily protein PhnB
MRCSIGLIALALVALETGAARAQSATSNRKESTMSVASAPSAASVPPSLTHLAPVLIVDAVEPSVAFWVERFGFRTANEVPGPDGKLVFASVEKDGIEIMYQTRGSVLAESPESAGDLQGHTATLFLTVDNLDVVERAVTGAPVVKPRHQTFYGSTELYVREPGGHTVGFAQFNK